MKKAKKKAVRRKPHVNSAGSVAVSTLKQRLAEAEAVMDVAAALAAAGQSLDEKLDRCLGIVLKRFQAGRGSIMLVDRDTKELVVRACVPARALGFRQPLDGDTVAARVVRAGEVLNATGSSAKAPRGAAQWNDYRKSAFIAYPIIARDRAVGVFNLTEKERGNFTRSDERALARFVDRIAVTIENAELHEKLLLSERALRTAEETYRLLVETAPDPIVIIAEGTILYANAACSRAIGARSAAALKGKRADSFLHPDSRGLFLRGIERMAKGKGGFPRSELKLLAADGRIRDIEGAAAAVSYEGKAAQQVIFRDVTERKQAEAELRKAKDEAEQATALKDKFVALVSHDLRTPLSAMLSLLGLLHRSASAALPAQERQMLERALDNGGTMMKMITRLLDISLLQTGRITLKKRFIDLHELAASVIDSMIPVAEAKGVAIHNTLPSGLTVHGDRELLGEVIGNLLSNAIKFTPGGRAVTLMGGMAKTVELTVADEGVGVKKENIPLLFRHDVRTSTVGTAGEKGTGLGLPLSHEIMLAHDGNLTAEAEEGKGSRFTLTLPRRVPEVLVVEDEEVDLFVVNTYLKQLGVNVTNAPTVQEALARIAERAPHVIITDLHLNGEDGFALLKALKAENASRGIPVIVFTNDMSIERREQAFASGARDFVTKPLQPHDFIPRIKRFLY